MTMVLINVNMVYQGEFKNNGGSTTQAVKWRMIDLSDVDYIDFVGQFMVNKELTSFSIFFFFSFFFLKTYV